jgi:hypothetical protein
MSPNLDRQVEARPNTVGGHNDRGRAADSQGKAASVAEGELLSARNGTQSAGKLRVIGGQRVDGDTGGDHKSADGRGVNLRVD